MLNATIRRPAKTFVRKLVSFAIHDDDLFHVYLRPVQYKTFSMTIFSTSDVVLVTDHDNIINKFWRQVDGDELEIVRT
jgi:hypothetical protein